MTKNELEALKDRFIEAAGHATQTFGFGRIIGQIFMHIYFSRTPQSLDDLTRMLGISKGSASMTVRQLESWGALRRMWVKGDRKDYYETTDEFGRIIRRALQDLIGERMAAADGLIEDADTRVQALRGHARTLDEDTQFFIERVGKIREFRKRAQGLWESPLIRMLMKK